MPWSEAIIMSVSGVGRSIQPVNNFNFSVCRNRDGAHGTGNRQNTYRRVLKLIFINFSFALRW